MRASAREVEAGRIDVAKALRGRGSLILHYATTYEKDKILRRQRQLEASFQMTAVSGDSKAEPKRSLGNPCPQRQHAGLGGGRAKWRGNHSPNLRFAQLQCEVLLVMSC